ncbi:MAG: ABC transporter ATP-binding protein [Acidobacteria bacterium]|nr:ABC transporter ATP-binding protein [Acidobacteriota bacterium]
MGCCVETVDLTHRFSEAEPALDRVRLQVTEGSIYGFLGPNGAGKTTTLRLILGLLKKQRGEIYVFGRPFTETRVETLRRLGSMIESPSIYAHLTAAENLQILQRVYRCPKRRVEEVLEVVGLARTGRKRAGQFSLGMKQRLGLALALLHAPTLLVLDEPTNGLDPNGILEMRGLLRTLNREHGVTILVSSHLLSEVEKLVTHVGIINHGRLLFQGTLAELLSRRRANASVVFETDDDAKAELVIRGLALSPNAVPGGVAIRGLEREQVAGVNRALVESGVGVFQIGRVESDLEKIFLDMVGG